MHGRDEALPEITHKCRWEMAAVEAKPSTTLEREGSIEVCAAQLAVAGGQGKQAPVTYTISAIVSVCFERSTAPRKQQILRHRGGNYSGKWRVTSFLIDDTAGTGK